MYYEEQIIDGKLYFRTTPTGNWLLIDYQKPLDRLIECQNELAQLKSNQESEVIENDDHDTEKYQIIFIHLSDGRRLAATVPEFCKEGDKLYLLPQFEVTEPREMPEGYSWSTIPRVKK